MRRTVRTTVEPRLQCLPMPIDAIHRRQRTSIPPASSVVEAMFADECRVDGPGVGMPRPELHLVVRFGPAANRGLDVHVLGARQRVTRKLIRQGQRTIVARLRLGQADAVLGAPPARFNGQAVPLEDVWSAADTQRLYDDLVETTRAADAATVLARAIAARRSPDHGQSHHALLACEAAKRLIDAGVSDVAAGLRISERHLRRVFSDAVGMSPKAFARLSRFSRATDLAREASRASWASIAAAAGYYDQAHLIEDFHAFAGATPGAFLRELDATRVLTGNDGAARLPWTADGIRVRLEPPPAGRGTRQS